jgi:hypothetical protein
VGTLFQKPKNKCEENIAARLRTVIVCRLSPDFIRLIDNSREFGYKEEINLQPATN